VRAGGWERVSDRDGVTVEWRSVDGSRVREVRATGVVELPIDRLFGALSDAEHYPEFMPPTESVRVLKQDGASKLLHVVIHPPWISRRDYCVIVSWPQLADGRRGSQWRQVDDGCPPPARGVVRHTRTEGTWMLRALDERHTLVEYDAIVDPGGSVPAWIVDRASAHAMRGMFHSLAVRATAPTYATP
jgi:uncharacterized membrane protein